MAVVVVAVDGTHAQGILHVGTAPNPSCLSADSHNFENEHFRVRPAAPNPCNVTTFGDRRAAAAPNPLCLSAGSHNFENERFRVRPAYGSSQ